MAKPWLGHYWQSYVRPSILARDQYRCQIRDPHCTGHARDVDHIVRPEEGGAWYDPANLRAACMRCNRSRGGRVGRQKQLQARVKPWPEWL